MKIQLSYESSPGSKIATGIKENYWEAQAVIKGVGKSAWPRIGRGRTPEEAIGALILGLKSGPVIAIEVPGMLEFLNPPEPNQAKVCPYCGCKEFVAAGEGKQTCLKCGAFVCVSEF